MLSGRSGTWSFLLSARLGGPDGLPKVKVCSADMEAHASPKHETSALAELHTTFVAVEGESPSLRFSLRHVATLSAMPILSMKHGRAIRPEVSIHLNREK